MTARPASPALQAISGLQSAQGWVHASSTPVDAGDPGRFHALFGRDSLIVALQVLPQRPDVAAATLRALAGLQGAADDPEIDEEPGKIVHEYRPIAPAWLIDRGWPLRDGGIRYYGTSDATCWFLVLLDAAGDPDLQAELRDACLAAGRWLERALDRGLGLVRCGPRRFLGGLAQQGWRDTQDPGSDEHGGGIVDAAGRTPPAPLADADSQAVAVSALTALTRLDPERRDHWQGRRDRLRALIAQRFRPGVMAIDGDDQPVPGAGSQLGWLLWSGALDGEDARAAVERLTRPDVLTEHGLRTLASTHPAFLVGGYHRGSVWPFDNWIGWGGLLAAGASDAAEYVRGGVLRAVAQLGDYPELYAVRPQDGAAERIPVANRVQAWTVGAVAAFELGWTGH